jgi:drug/metabolite transporter (DMT)-like permease
MGIRKETYDGPVQVLPSRVRNLHFLNSTSASAEVGRPVAGIASLTVGLMFFAVQDAMVKTMIDDYSVLQILFMRSVSAVPILIALLVWGHGLAGFRTAHPRLHTMRACLVLCAFLCYYLAVSKLPLVDVVALYGAAPLFITALAGPMLGERVGPRRWAAVAVGFIGVMIMLRPGSDVFEPVAVAGLLAALAYSFAALIARKIGPGEPSAFIALVSTSSFLVGCGIGLVAITVIDPTFESGSSMAPLLRPYITPDATDLALLLLLGLVTLSGFMLVPRAYQIAPASVISPFEYTYLLWAMLIGVVFFDETPARSTLVGAALVVAAGIYIARREAKLARTRADRTSQVSI